MNTYVLIYEGFTQFEVVLANYFLKTKGEIITVGINNNIVLSAEGFRTVPHTVLEEVKVEDVDLFIIPGGDPDKLISNKEFYNLLNKLNDEKKKIGAICSGTVHLAKSGVLNGKKFTTSVSIDEYKYFNKIDFKNDNIVVDGNILTAKANGYVDFAIELGTIMNIYKDEADLKETIDFFKYFKDS